MTDETMTRDDIERIHESAHFDTGVDQGSVQLGLDNLKDECLRLLGENERLRQSLQDRTDELELMYDEHLRKGSPLEGAGRRLIDERRQRQGNKEPAP